MVECLVSAGRTLVDRHPLAMLGTFLLFQGRVPVSCIGVDGMEWKCMQLHVDGVLKELGAAPQQIGSVLKSRVVAVLGVWLEV